MTKKNHTMLFSVNISASSQAESLHDYASEEGFSSYGMGRKQNLFNHTEALWTDLIGHYKLLKGEDDYIDDKWCAVCIDEKRYLRGHYKGN